MKIAIACDHRGYTVQAAASPAQVADRGHEVIDFGTDNPKPCDYPDFGIPAAKAVALGQADRGILIDGSGIGMSIIANKIPSIRAAICHDEFDRRDFAPSQQCEYPLFCGRPSRG